MERTRARRGHEYNVKPQVLLAHVLVQISPATIRAHQLYNYAARHAGERVKPTATAIKKAIVMAGACKN